VVKGGGWEKILQGHGGFFALNMGVMMSFQSLGCMVLPGPGSMISVCLVLLWYVVTFHLKNGTVVSFVLSNRKSPMMW